jgi:hypothetical protein
MSDDPTDFSDDGYLQCTFEFCLYFTKMFSLSNNGRMCLFVDYVYIR